MSEMVRLFARGERFRVSPAVDMLTDLEKLSDARGSVVLGWLSPGVFYLRLMGELSGALGAEGSDRFAAVLSNNECVTCFVDTFEVDSIDFAAKGAFLRAFMTRRRNLGQTLVLVNTPELETMARMIADIIGGGFTLTRNRDAFQTRVDDAAPSSDWRRRSGVPPKLTA
jgi:hypothetical protein